MDMQVADHLGFTANAAETGGFRGFEADGGAVAWPSGKNFPGKKSG
jgi:hypothetical protein